mmetsp:Transcript_12566/g.31963  ORF Transcript_12566/g.31963 Transcript_12566/m.31963 type:complete len:280 (-) Transcript_12566:455-1294(-)
MGRHRRESTLFKKMLLQTWKIWNPDVVLCIRKNLIDLQFESGRERNVGHHTITEVEWFLTKELFADETTLLEDGLLGSLLCFTLLAKAPLFRFLLCAFTFDAAGFTLESLLFTLTLTLLFFFLFLCSSFFTTLAFGFFALLLSFLTPQLLLFLLFFQFGAHLFQPPTAFLCSLLAIGQFVMTLILPVGFGAVIVLIVSVSWGVSRGRRGFICGFAEVRASTQTTESLFAFRFQLSHLCVAFFATFLTCTLTFFFESTFLRLSRLLTSQAFCFSFRYPSF